MTRVYSKALEKSIHVDRIIGHMEGEKKGPTLVFLAGVHGNEPSGVFALNYVLRKIKENKVPLAGNIYAISGNLWALEHGVRYHKEDLNRIWTKEIISQISQNGKDEVSKDRKELKELLTLINTILKEHSGPFYFFDLHTTSSETTPFLTVNDSMLNRKFTIQYPMPIILGIEEYLDGPLLNYINELGYVSFGHESGQHDNMSAIENHVAFINLSLVFTEAINKNDIDFHHYYDLLAKTTGDIRKIYEIYYRYKIRDHEDFEMQPGFFNFQLIKKGEIIAKSNGNPIATTHRGRIFMPLYQSQGSEGFFEIREVHSFFLVLSELFRKIKLDRFLTWLPGVEWASPNKDSLRVNRRIAFLFAKQFFHLLGYRSKTKGTQYLLVKNREARAKTEEYSQTLWVES